MTAPDRGATYQIALASTGSSTHDGLVPSTITEAGFTMSTTTEQNKAVIRRFFGAWNSRQPDAFDELIVPDVVRHCEATPGVEARNLDQVKEFPRQDTAVFPILCGRLSLWLPRGIRSLHGPRRKAQSDFGAVFRIEGGQIGEWWVTWDNMTILRALGHLPSD